MNRTLKLGLLVFVCLMVAAGLPALAAADGEETDTNESDTTHFDDLSPGEHLSGVMSAQAAELGGELDKHAFEHALEQADTDDERAALIAERIEDTQESVAAMNQEREELREAFQNDEITRAEYVSGLSELGTEQGNAVDRAEQAENATKGIPAETLEANGVNAEAIETLKHEASELSGPEVAAIAQTISGGGPGEGPPDDVPGNGTGAAGPGDDTPGQGNGDAGQGDNPGQNNGDAGQGDDTPTDGADGGDADTPGQGNGDAGQGDDTPTDDDDESEDDGPDNGTGPDNAGN